MKRATRIVHSSDIHIDDEVVRGSYDGLVGLRAVLETARMLAADVVLLAGDTFDNSRVSAPVLARSAALLDAATMPVVMLPGNHDPAFADSVYRRAGIVDLKHVAILGLTASEEMLLEDHDLEISGRAHRSWDDMTPLPAPRSRVARWRIVVAHGHYVAPAEWDEQSHRSWRISDGALAATDADYVALGHWDRAAEVGDGTVRAHYSGSPDLARSVNLVRLTPGEGVSVERVALNLVDGR
jgi:DNA repair exonuclease SbcCD nuclease subunit